MDTLLADIGGTHARFALLDSGTHGEVTTLAVADHADCAAAVTGWLGAAAPGLRLRRALLAVAGPVQDNRATLVNSPWGEVDGNRLIEQLGCEVRLLNDFEAVGWSLPVLRQDELAMIGPGAPDPTVPMVALGPGTGFGAACYLPQAGGLVLATEAGHTTLPATDLREADVVETLWARFGHVSVERVLSGPGLSNLLDAVAELEGLDIEPQTPADIVAAASQPGNPMAREAVQLFCRFFGTVAGNLALTFGARGGVFLAGGITPRIADVLARSQFRACFTAKGRFQPWLEGVPTAVITRPCPAMAGLAAVAQRGGWGGFVGTGIR